MIPLKLETLLEGRVVEHDRVEYKSGWNPSETIHTICAFANDYANVNGGYFVIGADAVDGIPILPPQGIPKENLDRIQQEVFQYCNAIVPRYIPKMEVVNYRNTNTFLLYLWCSAGDSGPYQAPVDVYSGKKGNKPADKTMRYWMRYGSVTTFAKTDELSELFDKFNSIPYDDRINRSATIDCIRRGYLEDFLRESNSSLASELNVRSLEDLLISLEVANETDTDIAIRNIGILMFAERPDKYIPGTQIDLVRFNTPDAEGSDDFTENTFTGPIHVQVREALRYIKTTVLDKKVVKIPNQAESESYYPYPYNALEEILVNAVFHKSYREPEPVEIRIYVDCIQIINYPGPAQWIDMVKFAEGKIRARKYRNRRIGEFFQEIDLSEKKSTGITKILRELKQNGSPLPEFETDPDRNYMITTVRIREGFEIGDEKSAQKNERTLSELLSELLNATDHKKLSAIIEHLETNDSITPKIAESLVNKSPATVRRYLGLLVRVKVLDPKGKANNTVYYKAIESIVAESTS